MRAIVTGYSSGIGQAIAKLLEENSYEVIRLSSRLNDKKALEEEIKQELKKADIDLLINCAGIGVFKPHEEISLDKIQELIDVNLTAPIVLTNLCLRSLKKNKRAYYKYLFNRSNKTLKVFSTLYCHKSRT